MDEADIVFKQEVVAKTILITKKKKYAFWSLNEEGASVDKITIKGLEIIRSDSPHIIKQKLRELVELILRDAEEKILKNKIIEYREIFKSASPDDLAENKSINNISKYISEEGPIKGTPYGLKAYHNWNLVRKELGLGDKYEDIEEGEKAKIIKLKPNKFGFETMAFVGQWPPEFDEEFQINYEKIIEDHFNKKLDALLSVTDKAHIIIEESPLLDMFFGD